MTKSSSLSRKKGHVPVAPLLIKHTKKNWTQRFPAIAAEVHPNANGNLQLTEIKGSDTVVFLCPQKCCNTDHVFTTQLYNRIGKRTTGCPFCSGRKTCHCKSLGAVNPELAAQIDTDKTTLDPFTISASGRNRLWWTCSNTSHPSWEATVSNRAKKTGCPKCAMTMHRVEEVTTAVAYDADGTEWRGITEFPGYSASNAVRVVNSEQTDYGLIRRDRTGTILSQFFNKTYKHVGLKLRTSDEGEESNFVRSVHYLVAVAFAIPRPTKKHDSIDHINRDRYDNRSTNLRWATKAEQTGNRDLIAPVNKKQRDIIRTCVTTGAKQEFEGFAAAVEDIEVQDMTFNAMKSAVYRAMETSSAVWGYKFDYATHAVNQCNWAPIPAKYVGGSEGYEASDVGGYIKTPRGRIIEGHKETYMRVTIGQGKKFAVHRLVCAAWNEFDPMLVVDHIDGDKYNNDASNLRCISARENVQAAAAAGNIKCKAVLQYSKEGDFIEEFISIGAASRAVGVVRSTVVKGCQSNSKVYGGFVWKYK